MEEDISLSQRIANLLGIDETMVYQNPLEIGILLKNHKYSNSDDRREGEHLYSDLAKTLSEYIRPPKENETEQTKDQEPLSYEQAIMRMYPSKVELTDLGKQVVEVLYLFEVEAVRDSNWLIQLGLVLKDYERYPRMQRPRTMARLVRLACERGEFYLDFRRPMNLEKLTEVEETLGDNNNIYGNMQILLEELVVPIRAVYEKQTNLAEKIADLLEVNEELVTANPLSTGAMLKSHAYQYPEDRQEGERLYNLIANHVSTYITQNPSTQN